MFTEPRAKILSKLSLQNKFRYFEKIKILLSKLAIDDLLLIHDVTAIHRINELFYGMDSEEYEYNTKLNIELYIENVLDYYSEKISVEVDGKYFNIELVMNNGMVYAQCTDFKDQYGEYYFVEQLTKQDALDEIKKVIKNLTFEMAIESKVGVLI